MAFDYTELAQVAEDLITEFGRPLVVVKVSEAAPDPSTPHLPPPTNETRTNVTGVIVKPKHEEVEGTSFADASRIAVVAGTAGALEGVEWLEDGADRYRVVAHEPIQPGDTLLAHRFGLRGHA